jgi:hypothetical protein
VSHQCFDGCSIDFDIQDDPVRLLLTPHPLSRSLAVAQIEAEIGCPHPDQLTLSYELTGNLAEIAIPLVGAPGRRANLWRATCFEAFLRAAGKPQYYEFNFSPSTEWAAYRFDDYRTGMREASEIAAVQIEQRSGENSYRLLAHLKIDSLADLACSSSWQIGLSAVIEERSGSKSYWSLVHPTGEPDFHHPASFANELVPRQRP